MGSSLCCRSRSWKCASTRATRVPSACLVSSVTTSRRRSAAVATRLSLTSSSSTGTGSLRRSATGQTSARASAVMCSSRSTRTHTSSRRRSLMAGPGHVATRQRCRPYRCFISMTATTSYMARYLAWLSTAAVARERPDTEKVRGQTARGRRTRRDAAKVAARDCRGWRTGDCTG